MPSQPYDLVQDDQDVRIPLHAEQAFERGIRFQAKVIFTKKNLSLNTK
jgi:carboxyl-terminal PDZ ligand of neuronal nitric oxide synthase protein